MYLHADRHREAMNYTVKLDGTTIPYAKAADDEAGWVLLYLTNEDGSLMLNEEGYPMLERRCGKVEFVMVEQE